MWRGCSKSTSEDDRRIAPPETVVKLSDNIARIIPEPRCLQSAVSTPMCWIRLSAWRTVEGVRPGATCQRGDQGLRAVSSFGGDDKSDGILLALGHRDRHGFAIDGAEEIGADSLGKIVVGYEPDAVRAGPP